MVIATVAVTALDYTEMMQAPDVRPSFSRNAFRSRNGEAFGRTAALASRRRAPGAELVPHDRSKRWRRRSPSNSPKTARLMRPAPSIRAAAERFADEIAKRGAYVKTVVLHSPGGSVQDALKIGRLIRERNFNTEVEDGALLRVLLPADLRRRRRADRRLRRLRSACIRFSPRRIVPRRASATA